mmetsp:Transcript_16918/g.48856  ORF Transcript_16918/g.48856 Transcript_16918/m.48856 type:complete len:231 (-) Transcript_16918:1433-2125(-)
MDGSEHGRRHGGRVGDEIFTFVGVRRGSSVGVSVATELFDDEGRDEGIGTFAQQYVEERVQGARVVLRCDSFGTAIVEIRKGARDRRSGPPGRHWLGPLLLPSVSLLVLRARGSRHPRHGPSPRIHRIPLHQGDGTIPSRRPRSQTIGIQESFTHIHALRRGAARSRDYTFHTRRTQVVVFEASHHGRRESGRILLRQGVGSMAFGPTRDFGERRGLRHRDRERIAHRGR